MAYKSVMAVDLETYSSVDLRTAGVYKYAESPDFEILLLAYAFDDDQVDVINLTPQKPDLALAEKIKLDAVKGALLDPEVIKTAYNANFERTCLARYLGEPMPPEQWQDTMVTAAELGLPRSLADVGTVLGLPEDQQKIREGKNLIQYFCKPCRPTKANGMRERNLPEDDPERWERFKEYCKRDVETERAIRDRLAGYSVPESEHELWCIDQNINDRGVRFDRTFVEHAARMDEQIKAELKDEAKRISGLENPNSPAQIKTWIKARTGVQVESLDKRVLGSVMEDLRGYDDVTRFLQIRRALAKTSTAKYSRAIVCANRDDRIRGLTQFYGAGTGRWSGRNLQLQNLKKNSMPDEDLDAARQIVRDGDRELLGLLYDPMEALSELIRTSFVPAPGYKFVVSDFSAIEARVLAWLAGEQWRLDAFNRGEDIYCSSASSMFGVPVEKHGVNGHLRQKGKVAELACIAEDSLVLTHKGLVPIQDVTTEHRLWDGEAWVSHDGVICKGRKEVITYEGLTATRDHLVFVEGQPEPVQFGLAAAGGAHLVQTGDGGQALRLGGGYQPGEEVEQELESLLRSDALHGMRIDTMAASGQPEKRKIERMPAVLTAQDDPQVARPEADCSEAAVREPERPELPQLRRARDPVPIRFYYGCGAIHDPELLLREAGPVAGDRQDRHERTLRAGEPALCGAPDKPGEPAQDGAQPLRSAILALRALCRHAKARIRDDQGRDHRRRAESGRRTAEKLADDKREARVYDIRNAGRRHRFTVSGRLVHNCGYGGSVGAMKAMGALEMGLTENELKPIVDSWRSANRQITKLWWDVDKKVKNCIRYGKRATRSGDGWATGRTYKVYRDNVLIEERRAVSAEQAVSHARYAEDRLYEDLSHYRAVLANPAENLRIRMDHELLRIGLPSGREISYFKPKVSAAGDITYEGQIQAGGWGRIETYGPKLVENIVQAISRDCLAVSMRRLRDAGIPVVFHVHDEVICEVPEGATSAPEVAELMGRPIDWAPGLPLRAEAYECEYYRKD